MKRSELMNRFQELFGDEDVELYIDAGDGELSTTYHLYLDDDGDAIIRVE